MPLLPDDLRRTGSRLYAVPLPPRPYEWLAILGAVLCLVAHELAIGELNVIASNGGDFPIEFPEDLRTAIGFSIAGFAVSLLALLKIWWQGHTRQGVVLAAYGLIVNPWMLYGIGWVVHQGPRAGQLHPYQSVFFVSSLATGTFLYLVYSFATNRVRARHGPLLAVGLLLLLGAGTTVAAWGMQSYLSRYDTERLEAYRRVLPESTTAARWKDVVGDGIYMGIVIRSTPEGTLTYRTVDLYLGWGFLYPDFEADSDATEKHLYWTEEPADPREVLRPWMDDLDEEVVARMGVPEQLWRDHSLFVSISSDRPAEQLRGLLEICRDVLPERSRVNLLTCRRPAIDWKRRLFIGSWEPELSFLPLETAAIPDAPTLHVAPAPGGLHFVLDLVEIKSESFLSALLGDRAAQGLNLEPSPDLTVAEVVHVIDLARAAGVERIAWP